MTRSGPLQHGAQPLCAGRARHVTWYSAPNPPFAPELRERAQPQCSLPAARGPLPPFLSRPFFSSAVARRSPPSVPPRLERRHGGGGGEPAAEGAGRAAAGRGARRRRDVAAEPDGDGPGAAVPAGRVDAGHRAAGGARRRRLGPAAGRQRPLHRAGGGGRAPGEAVPQRRYRFRGLFPSPPAHKVKSWGLIEFLPCSFREVRDGDGDGAGLQPRACAPSNKDDGSFRKPGAWGDVGPGGGGAAQSYPLNTSAWKIWSVICFYLFLCGALSHSQHLEFQTGYLWSIQEAYRQDLSLPEGFVPMGQRSQCSLFHSPFVHSQNKPR